MKFILKKIIPSFLWEFIKNIFYLKQRYQYSKISNDISANFKNVVYAVAIYKTSLLLKLLHEQVIICNKIILTPSKNTYYSVISVRYRERYYKIC